MGAGAANPPILLDPSTQKQISKSYNFSSKNGTSEAHPFVRPYHYKQQLLENILIIAPSTRSPSSCIFQHMSTHCHNRSSITHLNHLPTCQSPEATLSNFCISIHENLLKIAFHFLKMERDANNFFFLPPRHRLLIFFHLVKPHRVF